MKVSGHKMIFFEPGICIDEKHLSFYLKELSTVYELKSVEYPINEKCHV